MTEELKPEAGERNEGTKVVKGTNPFTGAISFLDNIINQFKANMVADTRGSTSYGYHSHSGVRGHFKQNQRITRKLSRRRKMKTSAR